MEVVQNFLETTSNQPDFLLAQGPDLAPSNLHNHLNMMEPPQACDKACSTAETEAPTTHATSKSPRDSLEKTKPYTAFTLFPKLPTELRLIIWMYAMPTNRHIIFATRGVSLTADGTLRCGLETFGVLPIFRACRESWRVVQQVCKPILNTRVDAVETSGALIKFEGNTKMIYNCLKDTVIIAGNGLMFMKATLSFLRTDILQRLSLAVGGWMGQPRFVSMCVAVRDRCPSLKFLRLLIGFGPVPFEGEHQEQAQLIRMDSNLSDQIHFAVQFFGEKKISADFSTNVDAVARRLRKSFSAFLASDGEIWRELDFDVCMVAIGRFDRKKLHKLLAIRWLMDAEEDGDELEQVMRVPIAHSMGYGYKVFHRYSGIPQLFGKSYSEGIWGQGDLESG